MSSDETTRRLEDVRRLLWVLIGLVLAMRLHLIFQLNFNWDEFHYLSYVYEYQRGELTYGWTNFHVHLFGWLTALGSDEISQLRIARLLLYGLTLLSTGMVYLIGRRFLSVEAALFSALGYASFSFVMTHGESFRPDPICTALFLVSLYWALKPDGRLRWPALAGVAMALSLNFTIKVAIHLLVVGAALWLAPVDDRSWRHRIARIGAFLATFATLFPTGFFLHRLSVAQGADAATTSFLERTASTVFGTGVWIPRIEYLTPALLENPLTWLAMALGAVVCLVRVLRARAQRRAATLLLILALPVCTLLVYRNAFPYYYVFILATGVLLGGVFVEILFERARADASPLSRWLAIVLCVAVFSSGLAHYSRNSRNRNEVQQELLDVVHTIFPEPVPYIDRCSMISSFPKVGFFMSTWGLQVYRDRGEPIVSELLRQEQPRFLLANVASLELSWPAAVYEQLRLPLMPEDIALLRANFLHHWGILHVLGKRFEPAPGGRSERFEIFVPGVYTVEGAGPVTIDGQQQPPGSTVRLSAGWHQLQSDHEGEVRLRWGESIYLPSEPPRRQAIFRSF